MPIRFLSGVIKWESRHIQLEIKREDRAGDVNLSKVVEGICSQEHVQGRREERREKMFDCEVLRNIEEDRAMETI